MRFLAFLLYVSLIGSFVFFCFYAGSASFWYVSCDCGIYTHASTPMTLSIRHERFSAIFESLHVTLWQMLCNCSIMVRPSVRGDNPSAQAYRRLG